MNFSRIICFALIFCCLRPGATLLFAQANPVPAGQQIEMGKKIYADQVYKTATANKDTGMLAEAYYLYGKMAIPVNDSVAIGWFQKSLKLLKPKGPSFEVGRLYFAIAILAKKHGNTKVYQKYIELGKQAIIASNSERGYKQFSGYFENKTLSNKNIDLNYSNAHIWVMEANSDFEKGDVITAKWKLDSAIKYFSNPSTRHAKLLVTGLFFRIPVNIKLNRFSDVKQDLAVARKIVFHEFPYRKDMINEFYKMELKYFLAINDFKSAYENRLKINEFEKKYFDKDREKNIQNLVESFESEEKEKEIEKINFEKELSLKNNRFQKTLLFVSFGFLLGLTILLGYLYKLYKINQKISKKNQKLVWEQNHRVKNNLQFITSMLEVQENYLEEKLTKSTFSDIKVRLQSMALLQKSLYRKKYLSGIYIQDYLDEIIENCLLSFDDEDVLINSEIDDVYLSPEKAQSVGLILTELIINSCKHAFKNSLRGEITFNLKKSESDIKITYSDSGGMDMEKVFESSEAGFGIEFIHSQIEQLKGKLTIKDLTNITIIFQTT